jgi:hypothetical protein
MRSPVFAHEIAAERDDIAAGAPLRELARGAEMLLEKGGVLG